MAKLDLSVYSDAELMVMRRALGLALAGVPRDEVVEQMTAEGIPDPEGYVSAAIEHVEQLMGLDGFTREFHIAARWALYGRAVKLDEVNAARQILADLARLQGYYPARQGLTPKGLAEASGLTPAAAVSSGNRAMPGNMVDLGAWLSAGDGGPEQDSTTKGPGSAALRGGKKAVAKAKPKAKRKSGG